MTSTVHSATEIYLRGDFIAWLPEAIKSINLNCQRREMKSSHSVNKRPWTLKLGHYLVGRLLTS